MIMKSKKLIASVLVTAMAVSMSGCADLDRNDEAVLDAANDYCEAVAKVKTGHIIDLLVDGDDYDDILDGIINGGDDRVEPEGYDDMVEAIAGTITFEINEDSVESSRKNKEGSVDVTFTMVDYQAVFERVHDGGGEIEDYIDALEASDADTVEFTRTLDLVLDNGSWLIDDPGIRDLSELYTFYGDALGYIFVSPLARYIDRVEWYYSDDDVYVNYDRIELDIIPTDDGYDEDFEFWYEYYLDGELIFTSAPCWDSGYWIESYYGPSYDSNCRLNEDGYLIPGQYRCVVYDMYDIVIADSTCTVETLDVDLGDDYIDHTEWYYSTNSVYTNETQIELDIIPTMGAGQSITWRFWYEYYLDGELIYTSGECTDSGYWIESYYGRNYDGAAQVTDEGYLVPGRYRCIVYTMDGEVLADSTCTVRVN